MFRRISPRIISSFGNGAGGTPRFRLCAPDEKVNMEKMNAVNLEKMYEVLKFVEYGGYCRRSMDCVHGMLLIDRMKNEAVVDKAVLFGWFRKMAVCAEQYERCGEGQNYKYLNPYGIVLSDEGEVLFLDTESRENAEVMKQMQKRAVRSHFIRPVYEMDTGGSREPDRVGYGDSSFLQVLKELPTVRNKTEKTDKKRVGVWSGIAAGAAGCILAAVYMGDAHTDLAVSNGEKITGEDIKTDTGTDIETIETDVETTKTGSETTELGVEMTETDMGKDKRANREAEVRSDRDGDTENEERKKDTADADEVKKNVTDESGKTDAAAEWMELYLDQHTDSGNQKAIEIGEKARLSVLWKLADAYERSGMKTEQIQTYGQLIEWEQDPIQLEEAGVRKMKLEAAQGDYKQAAETGKKVLERIEASEKITKMLKGYELYKGEEGES